MKHINRFLSIFLSCALIAGSVPVCADHIQAGTTARDTQAVETPVPDNQLTTDDIDALNGGKAAIYTHNDCVTFIDGTCAKGPVTDEKGAAAVVSSMTNLIGADEKTHFVPWRTVKDANGDTYYIFQQMYGDMTVCGGAVKVITDASGNMIGLSSSVESKLPDANTLEGISSAEAEEVVAEHAKETWQQELNIMSEYTDMTVLPSELKFDITSEDTTSRFVWVVYTDNPSGSMISGSDLPFLAHYVSMAGEYLYSMPAIMPGDEAGSSGYDSSYIFEFMEPAEYTGYVDMNDGTEKELTVTVMRDKRTGMYYLGNIERRIVVADCYEFLYDNSSIVLEYSPDNLEWDQVGLLSLYNYCRAYDYYDEIGWKGGDGLGTPILILNNFCDDRHKEINNACYIGKIAGFQCFAASQINDFSQCLDIIGHEFTHCVTGSVMTYNSYTNDYGAINEGMSDIHGKICDFLSGDTDTSDWIMGTHSLTPVRSMKEPHDFEQPEYTWDLYYHSKVSIPTPINDYGGVHTNSSLINLICCDLIDRGGMTPEEARLFWFMTDCTMVPKTDYVQLAEILPWVLKTAGMEQYSDVLADAIEATRLTLESKPEYFGDDRALVTMTLPDTEAFDTGNWSLFLTTVDIGGFRNTATDIVSDIVKGDFSDLPESIRALIMDIFAEEEAVEEEPEDGSTGGFFDIFMDELFSLSDVENEDEQAEDASEDESQEESDSEYMIIAAELQKWFKDKTKSFIFSGNGSAGQDGQTVEMVVRPGYTVPTLVHAVFKEGSETPDQMVTAIYTGGRWYDINEIISGDPSEDGTILDTMKNLLGKDILNEAAGIVMKHGIREGAVEAFLDLFMVHVEPGEVVTLSSDGLTELVIPEPAEEEDDTVYVITPGRKSRPKLAEEPAVESEAEAEARGEAGDSEAIPESEAA